VYDIKYRSFFSEEVLLPPITLRTLHNFKDVL
jgi:hypothetical protein